MNAFVELELLEFEVLIICFCTGCVSRRRDGRYLARLLVMNRQLSSKGGDPSHWKQISLFQRGNKYHHGRDDKISHSTPANQKSSRGSFYSFRVFTTSTVPVGQ